MSVPDAVSVGDAVSQWSAWKSAAECGTLNVDIDASRRLARACRNYVADLESALELVDSVDVVRGMGTLQSGIDLARKFSLKASGGEDSLEKSLLSHIDVLKEMEAYFQACVTRYFAVEAENMDRLARHEVSGS
ncbi:hypothetical protein [Rhodococcus globerulus]|uniref:hypothetical protein n=1 Tax=Rhodococcus globerulus TaxID=33008 RepID=UPI001F15E9BE|nr:hypothetical protein [Rhodococcus globerulus]MCE4265122.1 hypothetical protein [Rhodococcus globerulus]